MTYNYYEKHKEERKAYQKAHYWKNRETCLAYSAEYFQRVIKPIKQLIGWNMQSKPKPEPKPKSKPKPTADYSIKTTITYKEPVAKIPKQPKIKVPAPSKPVAERSGILTFD